MGSSFCSHFWTNRRSPRRQSSSVGPHSLDGQVIVEKSIGISNNQYKLPSFQSHSYLPPWLSLRNGLFIPPQHGETQIVMEISLTKCSTPSWLRNGVNPTSNRFYHQYKLLSRYFGIKVLLIVSYLTERFKSIVGRVLFLKMDIFLRFLRFPKSRSL